MLLKVAGATGLEPATSCVTVRIPTFREPPFSKAFTMVISIVHQVLTFLVKHYHILRNNDSNIQILVNRITLDS